MAERSAVNRNVDGSSPSRGVLVVRLKAADRLCGLLHVYPIYLDSVLFQRHEPYGASPCLHSCLPVEIDLRIGRNYRIQFNDEYLLEGVICAFEDKLWLSCELLLSEA